MECKIGLGTGRFGTLIDEKKAHDYLDYFYNNGGSIIDTARNYYEWVENGRGKSEECIGKWIKERKNRNKICICTKGGVRNEGKVFISNLSKESLSIEIKESLEALDTDYIDIYLLHRDEPGRYVEEIVETMQEISEIGRVGRIGVANWDIKRIKQANEYAKKNHMKTFEVIQTWWSLAEYTDSMWDDPTTTHMNEETYEYMLGNKIMGMAYTSQCKGYFQKAILNGRDSISELLKTRIETPCNLLKLQHIEKYCQRKAISPTAVVNGYITNNPLNGIALISITKMDQLVDIMKWKDYKLSKQFIREIDEVKTNR